MHSQSEREDFNRQMTTLCAAFNVPAKPETFESYWQAFKNLHLAAFTRMVEHAIGPEGETTKIPTVGQMWEIYRGFRKRADAAAPPPKPAPTGDRFQVITGKVLWLFMWRKGPFSPDTLAQLLVAKSQLIHDYRLIAAEEQISDLQFGMATYQRYSRVLGVDDLRLTHADIAFINGDTKAAA